MHITDSFDSGNIEVREVGQHGADLTVRDDAGGEFRQWFHFQVSGARDRQLELRIVNAGRCSYPAGWQDYRAVYSEDGADWLRTDTDYDGEVLTIRLRPRSDLVTLAYFAPYPFERHRALVQRVQCAAHARHGVAGLTLDGRAIDVLTFGEAGPGRQSVWVIARQHPGESMAEWWMEGFLARLSDADDPVARALRERAVLHVVPNMNPDGTARGHLRTNAAGANLNREWRNASLERSPEVFHVRALMQASGVDVCLDVHGDEALPVNFLAGYHGIPHLQPAHGERFERFKHTLAGLNPDFQTERGYPQTAPGKANLDICTSYIAHTFGACAMTLEMPFKDADNAPDPARGWSPARCMHLAHSCVDALHAQLRG